MARWWHRGPNPWRAWAAIAAASILAALLVHLVCALGPFDDAFIIFRYVENQLEGRGLVYNSGERVLGVSCPLYLGWLLMLKRALPSVDLLVLAVRGNAIFLAASSALAYALLRKLGFPPAAAALAAVATSLSEGILRASIGGMESSLYTALVFAALWSAAARRDTAALLLASLATLTRPEGILLLAVVAAARLADPAGSRWRPRPWLGLLPLVVWASWAMPYYGTPIPHSVVAKSRPLYPLPAGSALAAIGEWLGRWTFDGPLAIYLSVAERLAGFRLTEPLPRLVYQPIGVAITLWALWRWWRWWRWLRPAAAALPDAPPRRTLRDAALPVYLILLVAFYALSNPLLLPWYLPLFHAPWLAVVIAAAAGPVGRSRPPLRAVAIGAVLMVTITALASFAYHIGASGRSLIMFGGTTARQWDQLAAYARSADWLERNTGPADVVAAAEIGVLGYRLDRRILDACGLVTPEALPFIPVRPEERGSQLGPIPTGFIRATRPGFVVFLPAFGERSLLASAWFSGAYALAHEELLFPDEPGYRAVLIYRRR